jgi:hypothetical protein
VKFRHSTIAAREECVLCTVFACCTLAFALHLREKARKKKPVRVGHTVPATGLPTANSNQPKRLVVIEGYHCDHFCEQIGYQVGWKVQHKSLKEAWSNETSLFGIRMVRNSYCDTHSTDMLRAPPCLLTSRKCNKQTHTHTHTQGIGELGGGGGKGASAPGD